MHKDESGRPAPEPATEKGNRITAIILAGGLGTRLQSVVKDLPKCMAPVNGIPFLSYVIAHLQNNKIGHFIFSLGYKSEIIIDFLESAYPDLSKTYVVEKEQLGTGGAIKTACAFVKNKQVVIVNGDTFFNIDINKMVHFQERSKADCTIALKLIKNSSRYGKIVINSSGLVKSFTEKSQTSPGYINGGTYVLHVNSFLNEPLPATFSFEKEYLEKNIRVKKIYGIRYNKYFIDIGIPEDYEKATAQFANIRW